VASLAEASVNTYIGDPGSGSSFSASKIPCIVSSGQSPPPVALSLFIVTTNAAALVLSSNVTGPVAV
jgi:hypothetical protein